jgi:hypothetical protein
MAELLIKAIDATHSDPATDKRGCYKTGMIVEIRPDGCLYGASEGLPKFFIVKIPLVPVNHPLLIRLTNHQKQQDGFLPNSATVPNWLILRRRKCWLQYGNIPVGAQNKLATTGQLIIKASPNYNGPYDYTWTQVKNYFWDDDLQANITDDLG